MSAEARLNEIEERAKKATPEPWRAEEHFGPSDPEWWADHGEGPTLWMPEGLGWIDQDEHGRYMTQADADFIAHARSDVPWLVGRVRALGEHMRALVSDADRWSKAYAGVCDEKAEAEERVRALERVAEATAPFMAAIEADERANPPGHASSVIRLHRNDYAPLRAALAALAALDAVPPAAPEKTA